MKIVSSPGEADHGVRSRLEMDGIKVIDFPWHEERGFANTLRSAAFLSKIIQDFQPDVIHTWGLAHTLRFWLALKQSRLRRRVPIVTTLSSIRHGKAEEWPARIVAAQIFNVLPGRVCVQCSSEKSKMIKAGMLGKKLSMIPLCINENYSKGNFENKSVEFKKKYNLDHRIGIVYLAQFVPRKGHAYLLKAAREVIERHPECLFILAGTGPILGEVKRKTHQMGLDNHVNFPGQIDVKDVPALLHSTHLAAVPSLSETFGSVIVEPLLIGRPVVTTDVGIARDLAAVKGVAVVPPRDSKALARELLYYIENSEVAEKDAGRGKKYILSNCRLEFVAKRYLSVFKECVS